MLALKHDILVKCSSGLIGVTTCYGLITFLLQGALEQILPCITTCYSLITFLLQRALEQILPCTTTCYGLITFLLQGALERILPCLTMRARENPADNVLTSEDDSISLPNCSSNLLCYDKYLFGLSISRTFKVLMSPCPGARDL